MEPAEPVRLFITWGEAPQARAPGYGIPNNPGALGEGDAVFPPERPATIQLTPTSDPQALSRHRHLRGQTMEPAEPVGLFIAWGEAPQA